MKKFVSRLLVLIICCIGFMGFVHVSLANLEEADREEFRETVAHLERRCATYCIVDTTDNIVTLQGEHRAVICPMALELPDELIGQKGIGGVMNNRLHLSFEDGSCYSVIIQDYAGDDMEIRFPLYVQ